MSQKSSDMNDIHRIKNAIDALLPPELADLRRWFAEFDAWEHQR